MNKVCIWEPRRVLALSLLLCGGCAVGPNFQTPPAPQVKEYTTNPLLSLAGATNISGGDTQHFEPKADVSGAWWTLFHSKPLDELIEHSLSNNPTIKAAQAALMAAHETTLAQKGAFFPNVSASFSAARQKTPEEISSVPNSGALYFDLYTPQVSVSYVPDVFGLNRRTVESLKAQEQQARFSLAASHIALSANVVVAAIQEASLRGQIAATYQLVGINSNMLQVLRNQFAKGYVSRLDVAAQESQLAQVSATLPPLLKQIAQQRDLLAVLAGEFPTRELAHQFELDGLQLPQALPLSLPAQLVAQRPDVRQAEEALHFASAQVGIAIANRLPNITLTATAGSQALEPDKIFSSGTSFWTLAGTFTQPIFQGGALLHKERAARAAYAQAAEQYRNTVLTAFQNVADTLNALQQDGTGLSTAVAARDAAKVTLDLAQRQFQAGYANYLAFLSAEQTYLQARITLVQAQANRYADTAALFLALGGGWWNRQDLAKN